MNPRTRHFIYPLMLTVLVAISGNSQISTFPYTENFDSVATPTLPSGWISSQNRTQGINDFTTSATTPHSLPNAVGSTNATISQSLTSPLIDFSEKVPERLQFYTRRSATHLAHVVVEASLDSGRTFTIPMGDTLTNTNPNNYVLSSFVIPESLANRNGVKFRWRIIADASGSTATFRIDDIAVTVQTSHDLALVAMRFSPALPVEQDSVRAFAVVKNVGLQAAPSFLVNFYNDLNHDSLPQPVELVSVVSSFLPLAVSDSVEVFASLGAFDAGEQLIIGQVAYQSDQNPQNDRIHSALRIGYHTRSVIVNEIMYAPTGTEPEWVELYNERSDTINIKDWLVSDNIVTSKKVITSSPIMIPPAGYAILTKDSAALIDIHPNIPSRIINVTGFPTLNNTGDAIILYDNRVAMMDSVAYLPSWGGGSGGRSLERIDPSGSSTLQLNWSTSRHSERSTPGRRNSVTRKDYDLAVDTLLLSPQFPIHGDSIVATIKVKNIGYQQATSFVLRLFDDLNNDSIPQPGELVRSALQSIPLAPLDSLVFSFPPLWPTRNDQLLIGEVGFSPDEDSSNNYEFAHARVGYQSGSLVISEIMYGPVNEPEWVELYNVTAESIDVKDWKVSNRTTTSRYVIASSTVYAPPHGYVIIAKDTALLAQRYVGLPGLVLQAPTLPTFLFNNSGDAVVMFDNRDLQMDSVKYTPAWGGSGGASLERIDALEVSNDSLNWSSSVDSMRATPGRENSVAALDYDLRVMKNATLIAPPHVATTLSLTVKNVGRLVSTDFDVAFFDDRNRDSVATPEELVVRMRVTQSLARRETLRVSGEWPDPAPGVHSMVARVEYASDMRLSNNSTIFAAKIGYEPRAVVVNEIMYAPFTNEAEYVELLNLGTLDVDLSGWKLSDRPGTSGTSNEVALVSHDHLLPPGGFFVIASDSSFFSRFHNLDTTQLKFMTVANQSSLGLNNDGDAVIIRDATGTTVDSVAYLPAWHNSNVTDKTGRSLEKIHPNLASNDRRSWSTCVLGVGGTPGSPNSIFATVLPSQARISCSPNPFSPDGDGIEDFSVVHYELPTDIATVRIKIYDVKGRLVRQLINNESSGANREVPWDGYDDERQKARVGIYIVLVEGLNEGGGSVYSAKGVVVLAAKL